MKICILTQPLHNNYGGLIQAFALQRVLISLGHEVWTEDRRHDITFLSRVKDVSSIRKVFGKKNKPKTSEKEYILQHLRSFINENIQTTSPIWDKKKKELRKYSFDAYVVGSDQVWRPKYSPFLYNYFLDFIVDKDVKRVSYAASFGTSEWEYTDSQTQKCKKLIHHFDGISVREDSAVELCAKHFNVETTQVLDPTMLLSRQDYISMSKQIKDISSENILLYYILDDYGDNKSMIDFLSNQMRLASYAIMPKRTDYKIADTEDIEDYVYPSPERWISGFRDAKFIITDSFHGTVFAIIFNKPFISISNCGRGSSRFTSLLKLFGLEERLVYSLKNINIDLANSQIDWDRVNQIVKEKREDAINFLKMNL